jgi:hypothetical protein
MRGVKKGKREYQRRESGEKRIKRESRREVER